MNDDKFSEKIETASEFICEWKRDVWSFKPNMVANIEQRYINAGMYAVHNGQKSG